MYHWQTKTQKTLNRFLTVFAFVIFYLVIFASSVEAASLYITPAAPSAAVGNIVSVKVLVGTDGKAINNADAVIQYPTDLLEAVSVSRSQSVFSIWVEEPQFSNNNGQITFNGGVPTPGFTGQGGEIMSVVFKAKKAGAASLVFGDSAVRENDGLGTDILTSKQNAVVLIAAATVEIPVVTPVSNLPPKPTVTSVTHPEQGSWYSGTTASFSWVVPNGVTSIQTLLSKSPTAVPIITYDGSVSQRTVNNLGDDVLYFHVRYMNNVGWGPTEHYKVQIDSTPPERLSTDVNKKGVRDVLSIDAYDAMSGVDSYSIKIDNQSNLKISASVVTGGEYVLPTQNAGQHDLEVIAYDKAGNHKESRISYTSSPITPPEIQVSSNKIQLGETVGVTGKSDYPNSPVVVYIQIGDKKAAITETKTDGAGAFSITSAELKNSGTALVWAELVFSNSVKSPASQKLAVNIVDNYAVRTSKTVLYTLAYVIPAILLLLGLIFMVYLGWHKFFGLRKRLSKEVESTVEEVHKTLGLFKDELSDQLEKLEKLKTDRDLNKKEEKIFKDLQKNIDDIDNLIEKRIKKIK